MMRRFKWVALFIIVFSCNTDDDSQIDPGGSDEGDGIYRLPVVVHVLHNGEVPGEGPNLSKERIERQIEILNEDFRRKEGSKGYNTHLAGGDARIMFVLAKQDQEGNPTEGIVRVDVSQHGLPDFSQNAHAAFSYWDPLRYINIWTTPLPEAATCIALGNATGPETDLPGTGLLAIPGPGDAEGILINGMHFGESSIHCHARFGRTLTHEMGHYLGLLHTWGGNDCEFNDYCDDTPSIDRAVYGKDAYPGCDGEMIMIGNYMNYSHDDVMNIFTNDQIARMHYVLENHEGRKGLLSSPGLVQP